MKLPHEKKIINILTQVIIQGKSLKLLFCQF
jgi:hypothetical protein